MDGIGSPGGRGYRAPYGANKMGTWTHSVARNRKQTTKSTSETNAAKNDNDDKEMIKG